MRSRMVWQAFSTAMPFRSVPELAAVAEVRGIAAPPLSGNDDVREGDGAAYAEAADRLHMFLDNEFVAIVGRGPAAEGFEPRDHTELGRMLGAIDIERAAKVSGSRFYYLTGVGALLELFLVVCLAGLRDELVRDVLQLRLVRRRRRRSQGVATGALRRAH